ncbi:MAG: galactokinase, partial [Myxococcota bacterium]|nr:galactokinase [Myxococcota bacterium]
QGTGLSSSASLEVAVGLFLSLIGEVVLDAQTIALVAQQAENEFVGCQCGIMDQLASAAGLANHCLLIDCLSLEVRPVPMPEELAIVIVNSNVRRGLVESAYNERRLQCEGAARALGVTSLREVDMAQLRANESRIDPVQFRRARHVVSENQRTSLMANALTQGKLDDVGALMARSHWSLNEDFEVTVPQLDLLVNLIEPTVRHVGGVRMTGGGFGGCVVVLAPIDRVDAVQRAVNDGYAQQTGLVPDIYVCSASDGAGTLDI